MKPGEIACAPGTISLAPGRRRLDLTVRNVSDRPIGVGSHCPFDGVTRALQFDRDGARRMRLDVPAGEITWFDPGQEHVVTLVANAGEEAPE